MTLPKHLEDAVKKLEEASNRIDKAKDKPVTLESLQEWLLALTYYSRATSEIHQLNNESLHEKVHELASRIGLRKFPSSSI